MKLRNVIQIRKLFIDGLTKLRRPTQENSIKRRGLRKIVTDGGKLRELQNQVVTILSNEGPIEERDIEGFCCKCEKTGSANQASNLPLICLVPRDGAAPANAGPSKPPAPGRKSSNGSGFRLLDDDYIKKNFKLPQRALYLDPFRKPLISFPMGGQPKNFNMARKNKINQMILDGFLDPCEAITAPSVFPYPKFDAVEQKAAEEDEEIIYILQLPDIESRCPVHNQTIRTPRFIWHTCKKSKKKDDGEMKPGGGPLNKPKPWLLSRHTDFDLQSQW